MNKRCVKFGIMLLLILIGMAIFTQVEVKSADRGNTVQLRLTKRMDGHFPKIPHKSSDHIYFSTFDGKYVYSNQDTTKGFVARPPFQMEKKMFDQLRLYAIKYFKKEKNTKYQEKDCMYI
ncbi:hypothetical protein SK128_006738, partial [Halocaridina rubra]